MLLLLQFHLGFPGLSILDGFLGGGFSGCSSIWLLQVCMGCFKLVFWTEIGVWMSIGIGAQEGFECEFTLR